MNVIEEDTGIYVGNEHPHNGYYAGDFSGQPLTSLEARCPLHAQEDPA